MKNAIILIIFFFLIYFPLFYRLDAPPIKMWDESRNAVNAIEMIQNGNYMVRHYTGHPDEWETKPPLLIWLQVASMKVLGINELAIRIPSAISGLLIIALILFLFKREFNDLYTGILASLVLVTTPGFINEHVTRTGDHDALLSLFVIFYVISFYLYIKYKQTKFLTAATIGIIGAVLTKSIAGLMLLPGLLIYVVITKNFIQVITDRRIYLAIGAFIVFIGGFYYLKEYYQPGYLKLIWENELFPRYFNTAETYSYNEKDVYYYLRNFWQYSYPYWLFFILPSILITYFNKEKEYTQVSIFLTIVSLVFLIIISNGTNNYWYDAPIYPLLAIIIGIGIRSLYSLIHRYFSYRNIYIKTIFYSLTCIIIFAIPYKDIINKISKFKPESRDIKYGYFIRDLSKNNKDLKEYNVLYTGYNAQVIYYQQWANYDKKMSISFSNINEISIGNVYMTCEPEFLEKTKNEFNVEVISTFEECEVIKILDKKNN